MALVIGGCGGRPGILPGWGDADGGAVDGPPRDSTPRDGSGDGPLLRNDCPMGGGLQPGSPWAMRGRCPSHIGRALVSGPGSPDVRWTFETEGPVSGSPVVAADGTVYIGSDDHHLYAIAPDGTERWRFETEGKVNGTPAIGVDGTVYFGNDASRLQAVSATGELRWDVYLRQAAGSEAASPLIGDDGVIYVGDVDDQFHALDLDGVELWSWTCPNGCAFWSPPAQGSDGTVYVGSSSAKLHAFTADGQPRWALDVDNSIHGAPAVGDGDVVYAAAGIAHQHDTLYAVRSSGSLLWTATITESSLSSVSPSIGADGTIYAGFDDGTMRAFSTSGSHLWSFDTGSPYLTAAALDADGTLYFGASDGRLYAVSSTGKLRWIVPTGAQVNSAPAIGADGTLYFGSRDRLVYAIGP